MPKANRAGRQLSGSGISGKSGVFSGLGFVEKFATFIGVTPDHLGFEFYKTGIIPKHVEFLHVLEVSREKKRVRIFRFDVATGTKIMSFADSMKTGTTLPDHTLDDFLGRLGHQFIKGDVVNHRSRIVV